MAKKKMCSATKRDGTPCKAPALGRSVKCWAHAPEHAEQRRQQASKAGSSKGATGRATEPSELSEIKAKLRQIAEDVVSDKVSTAKGSVASQIYGVLLRALEAERKERELVEVQAEMVELREMFARGDSGGGAWMH